MYTILFFVSVFLLAFLCFDLLIRIDKGAGFKGLALILMGILVSIGLLTFSIVRYLKIPGSGEDH